MYLGRPRLINLPKKLESKVMQLPNMFLAQKLSFRSTAIGEQAVKILGMEYRVFS